jgi:hypothetical protein
VFTAMKQMQAMWAAGVFERNEARDPAHTKSAAGGLLRKQRSCTPDAQLAPKTIGCCTSPAFEQQVAPAQD